MYKFPLKNDLTHPDQKDTFHLKNKSDKKITKIIIERDPIGLLLSGHIYLYAYDEDHKIKFDFFPEGDYALQHLVNINDNRLNSLYNNNVVELESHIPVKNLINAISASQYMYGFKWDIKSTCVDAVIFALEQAGISLNLDKNYKCKHLAACCCCATTITTPKDLLQAIKDYKTNQLTKLGYFKEFENSIQSIKTHPFQSIKLQHSVFAIVAELNSIKKISPENIKLLNDISHKTYDLLVNYSEDKYYQYRTLAQGIQNSHSGWWHKLGALMIFFGLVALTAIGITAVVAGSRVISNNSLLVPGSISLLLGIGLFATGHLLAKQPAKLKNLMLTFSHDMNASINSETGELTFAVKKAT